jgi:hypothetical protein
MQPADELTMRIPTIRGIIDRRLLVNYRVDPDVLASLLPPPFRPKLVDGMGMVGICLIRLKSVRPVWLPAWAGISSENAAHRAAVQWDDHGEVREGVYIRRRDTDSRLNALGGGRLFPGIHHHACFAVSETPERFEVALHSGDGATNVEVRARLADAWSTSSIFPSLVAASAFFQAGSVGYSATANESRYDGLELRCDTWDVEPLAVGHVRSSYFDDATIFPRGSIEFDNALLMRGIEHLWHGLPDLCCEAASPVEAAASV